jgi:hypothetical protein
MKKPIIGMMAVRVKKSRTPTTMRKVMIKKRVNGLMIKASSVIVRLRHKW